MVGRTFNIIIYTVSLNVPCEIHLNFYNERFELEIDLAPDYCIGFWATTSPIPVPGNLPLRMGTLDGCRYIREKLVGQYALGQALSFSFPELLSVSV